MTDDAPTQVTAKGFDSTVRFDGRTVTIDRRMTSPLGRGARSIPLRQIAGVELRAPTFVDNSGALTFVVPGSDHRRSAWSGKRDERRDENTVLFHGKKKHRQFEALRNAVLAAL